MIVSDLLGFEVVSDLVCEFFGVNIGEQWCVLVDFDFFIWRGDSGGDDDGVRLECCYLGGDVGCFVFFYCCGDVLIMQYLL